MHAVALTMELTGSTLHDAVHGTLGVLGEGQGGMIAVDAAGNPCMHFTTGTHVTCRC